MFQGFKYIPVIPEGYSYEILAPLFEHTKTVICNGDEQKYDYFMKWFANLFQNVTVKNGTMMIIHGAQGSGKSVTVELFAELLGNFALANVDDLDKVFGKFNGLLSRHLYININEPPEATEKFSYTGKIKSKLTQTKTIRETKGVDQVQVDSWANYTMTTNNPNPVQEEKGNRRFVYFETNNKFVGNLEYFNNLCKDFQPNGKQSAYKKEYMNTLLHYMIHEIDVSGFNPEQLIRDINSRTNVDYNENLQRQYECLNKVDQYVVDHYEMFVEGGVTLNDISDIDGYKANGIAKKLQAICDAKRVKIAGVKTTVYKLKPREQIPDLYNIIDYIHYENQEEEQE